jgi:hypothetical protein
VTNALERGNRILVHLLASSKTGLRAPATEAIEQLQQIAPGEIDVVVDACQMRTPFYEIGAWVRRGWIVQVSGSKFLTGPAFSGALVIPSRFRAIWQAVESLLEEAPGVGWKEDWSRNFRDHFSISNHKGVPSFGPIFRWVPALLEAELFNSIPDELKTYSFNRFREALNERLDQSQWLVRIDCNGASCQLDEAFDLATASIICFSIAVSKWNGEKRLLDEQECRKIFEALNADMSDQLGQLTLVERAVARLHAHIGQPVVLKSCDGGTRTVLRLVLGARFFSIVAHAGQGAVEAALESEISDAIRALEKLELLAQNWTNLATVRTYN